MAPKPGSSNIVPILLYDNTRLQADDKMFQSMLTTRTWAGWVGGAGHPDVNYYKNKITEPSKMYNILL